MLKEMRKREIIEIDQVIEKTLRNLPNEKAPEIYKTKLKRMIRAKQSSSWHHILVSILLLGSFGILTLREGFFAHSLMSRNILIGTFTILGFLSIMVLIPVAERMVRENVRFLQKSEMYLEKFLDYIRG